MRLICDCGHEGEYVVNDIIKTTNGNGEPVTYQEGQFTGFHSLIVSEHHSIFGITCKCGKSIQLF